MCHRERATGWPGIVVRIEERNCFSNRIAGRRNVVTEGIAQRRNKGAVVVDDGLPGVRRVRQMGGLEFSKNVEIAPLRRNPALIWKQTWPWKAVCRERTVVKGVGPEHGLPVRLLLKKRRN